MNINNKKMFSVISLLSVTLLSACGYIEGPEEETKPMGIFYSYKGYYEYPVEDNMSAGDIIKACRIDEEILKTMSTEQVCQAIADFPMLSIVFLSSSQLCDTSSLIKKSDAYAELLEREDAKDEFISKIREIETTEDSTLAEILKMIALSEPEISKSLSEEEREYLSSSN